MPKLPGVPHQKAIGALEKAGFRVLRQGKHVVMTERLPKRDQQALLRTIDAFLSKAG